jgi:hypothetical protein
LRRFKHADGKGHVRFDATYVTNHWDRRLGYRLLSPEEGQRSDEILKLNVETYPQSANVYDSLGEAYMINGD